MHTTNNIIKKIILLQQIFQNIYSEIICPQKCVICGEASEQCISLCKKCISNLFFYSLKNRLDNTTKFCKKCGKELISEKILCTRCKTILSTDENIQYDKVYTLFPYVGDGQKIVYEWKNKGMRGYAYLFSIIIYNFIKNIDNLKNIPIIPVPPRPKKLVTKGWDQINDIANYLKYYHKLKVLKYLKRLDGTPQKSVIVKDRKNNLLNKFYITKKHLNKIPETVILIDDIFTTGSTISECSKILKINGCKKVIGITIFFD